PGGTPRPAAGGASSARPARRRRRLTCPRRSDPSPLGVFAWRCQGTPIAPATMARMSDLAPLRERLRAAERSGREQRDRLFAAVRDDPAFQDERITIYDHDTLDNVDFILRLLDDRMQARLDGTANRTMIDIGCANGELGFAFEEAGFSVALLDRGHVADAQGSAIRQNAPLV